MKIYGYVRDENGNFEKRKRKIIEFSKLVDFPIDKMIYEQSSENYEDMTEIRKLLETERDFILLVSDTSDLFEDDYARANFCWKMDDKNVFLIDCHYPKFNYKSLITDRYKIEPFDFLTNATMSAMEVYLRKVEAADGSKIPIDELKQKLNNWQSSLADTCDNI